MSNKEAQKRWRLANPIQAKAMQKRSYQKNRSYYLDKRKEYRQENHQDVLDYNKKYRQNHPEKFVKYLQKHFQKLKITPTWKYYKKLLNSWSWAIRKRDNNKCQICGKPAVNAHHIFHKALYPQLALNLNNGIALCLQHHNESHGRFT